MHNDGIEFHEILNKTCIASTTFRRLLKKENIPMNIKIDKLASKKELGLKLFKEGVNKEKISRDVGISVKALNRHIRLNS
mgnify:CR=1 FL=1